jgi:ribosomal protein S8
MNELANFCSILNVAGAAIDKVVLLRISNISKELLTILYRNGIINNFFIRNNEFLVVLKFFRSKSFLKKIKIVSTPGHRVY